MNLRNALTSPVRLLASAVGLKTTFNLTGAATITAADDDNKLPRFSMEAYDGGAMKVSAFWDPVVIDLQGARARKRVRAFYEHDRHQIVGHAEKVTINTTGIVVDGVMSGSGPHVDQIVASAKNGFEWESSIGAAVVRHEYVEAGKSVEVNGKTFSGPIVVARETEIYEASFTAIGAAGETSARVAATGQDHQGENAMTFEQWLQAHGFEPDKITDQQRPTLQAAYDASQQQPQPAPPSASAPAAPAPTQPTQTVHANMPAPPDILATFRQESARVSKIQQICAMHGNPKITVDEKGIDLCAHAIAEGFTTEQTELHALRAARPSNVAPFANVGGRNGGPANAQVIEASMCLAQGMPEDFVGKQYDENTVNAAMESPMRGFGLHQLLWASIAANGGHVQAGSRVGDDVITAALQTDPLLRGATTIQASGFSTISLSGILSNVANKAMLRRFDSLNSALREVASETSTNNFKEFKRYRLDGKGQFGLVGQDGELKHIQLVESEYANQLQTRGGMIALTRQMQIDDDMGAFLQLPLIFAELAMHALEQQGFTVLLGNAGSFFSSGNGNYFEGAATAPSVPSYNSAVQLFREQTNAGERFIMVNPDRVLCPPALEGTVKELHQSTEVRDTTANTRKPTKNIHAGSYRPVVSPYIGSASGLSGASDAHWYLLAPPSEGHSVVQIAFLQGNRRPTIGSAQADFNVLGMQWRSFWDFGVALHEKRAGVRSKGKA